MHIGFVIPSKAETFPEEQKLPEIRVFEPHISTPVSEVIKWVKQFYDGYFDILYDRVSEEPYMANCERKNLSVLSKYTFLQILRLEYVRKITWKKHSINEYSNQYRDFSGNNHQIF